MKKVISSLVLFTMLLSGSSVLASGVCLTKTQVDAKLLYFQKQALNSSNTSLDATMKLLDEQDAFIKSLYTGCLEYFQTTPTPDCQRISTLITGYIMLDKKEQPAAKTKVQALKTPLSKKCPTASQMIDMMVK